MQTKTRPADILTSMTKENTKQENTYLAQVYALLSKMAKFQVAWQYFEVKDKND